MWLFYALLTPFFWSIVHVMDYYCVGKVFNKPWMGVTTSSLASVMVLAIVPFVFPTLNQYMLAFDAMFLALCIGILIQVSQWFYFNALAHSEAGIIAAYWNLTPAMLPIFAFAVAGTLLTASQYIGIIILILASVSFRLVARHLESSWNTLLLMLVASILQVFALTLEDSLFQKVPYIVGFLFIILGIILTGIIPLLFRNTRRDFLISAKKIKGAAVIIVGIEFANLLALATSQKAIALGIPSLVAAIESTIPGYTFVLSFLLFSVFSKFGDLRSREKLSIKFSLVIAMTLGVWLVS